MLISQPFNFDVDVEVFQKSGEGEKERRIGGFVSDPDDDQQGERIIQSGLDFQHFLTKGWFNDNHSRDTAGIVGYPEIAELRTRAGKPAWYVEGYLLKGHPRADELWTLANALQKSGRRLGYSVEGKILERQGPQGEIIAKALVKNVAITNCPVNDRTSLEVLAKSLATMNKALAASPGAVGGEGGPAYGEGVVGGGQILVPRSMGHDAKKCRCAKCKKSRSNGGLTKAAGVSFILTRRPDLTVAAAERLYWASFADKLA